MTAQDIRDLTAALLEHERLFGTGSTAELAALSATEHVLADTQEELAALKQQLASIEWHRDGATRLRVVS